MSKSLAMLVAAAAIAVTIASCGGGTDGTGAVPPPGTITSSGVMTKGSVVLNGTHFDPASATIIDDRGRTAAQLDNGMVIKLLGQSEDGLTGVAERISVYSEARGTIQSIDATSTPRRFTVAGLTVVVDDKTVFADVAGFVALTVGARVEVHGLRDTSGLLHASRVEVVGAQDGADEIRGVLGNPSTDTHRFTLNGTITVDYTGATFTPAGASEASLAAGIPVEVHGTLTGNLFTATQVEIQNLADIPFQGDPGQRQEVEGFVSGFTLHPGTFQVSGQTIRTGTATAFNGGTADDLADDVNVEVEGVLDAQRVLVATSVQFQSTRVTLQGITTAVDVAARRVAVMGAVAQVDDLTRIQTRPDSGGGNSSSLADLVADVDCVNVRGHMQGAVLVAERVMERNQCNAPDQIQASVTGKDEANGTLSFFGGTLIATLPADGQFEDSNATSLTRAAFLARMNPGTLVDLRGRFSGGTFVTESAGIRN